MTQIRRPALHDTQPPPLYRTGLTLRRTFLTGPAQTPEEEAMKALLNRADHDARHGSQA